MAKKIFHTRWWICPKCGTHIPIIKHPYKRCSRCGAKLPDPHEEARKVNERIRKERERLEKEWWSDLIKKRKDVE